VYYQQAFHYAAQLPHQQAQQVYRAPLQQQQQQQKQQQQQQYRWFFFFDPVWIIVPDWSTV